MQISVYNCFVVIITGPKYESITAYCRYIRNKYHKIAVGIGWYWQIFFFIYVSKVQYRLDNNGNFGHFYVIFEGFNLPKTHPKLIILSINCISINFQKYLLCITTYIEILIVYRDIIKYTVIEDFIHITCPWMYCESWIWCKLCFCGPIRIFHIDNHH